MDHKQEFSNSDAIICVSTRSKGNRHLNRKVTFVGDKRNEFYAYQKRSSTSVTLIGMVSADENSGTFSKDISKPDCDIYFIISTGKGANKNLFAVNYDVSHYFYVEDAEEFKPAKKSKKLNELDKQLFKRLVDKAVEELKK